MMSDGGDMLSDDGDMLSDCRDMLVDPSWIYTYMCLHIY